MGAASGKGGRLFERRVALTPWGRERAGMAKYEPLVRYLRRQKKAEVELSFRDIERIVGGLLPKASANPGWWRVEHASSAPPQQRAFAEAGYAPEPELKAERVRFVRITAAVPGVLAE